MTSGFKCEVIWKFPEVMVDVNSHFVQLSKCPYNDDRLNTLVCHPNEKILRVLTEDECNDFECIKGAVELYGTPITEFAELLNDNLGSVIEGVNRSYKDIYAIDAMYIHDFSGTFTMQKSEPFCMRYLPEMKVNFTLLIDGVDKCPKDVGYSAIGVITARVRQATLCHPNGVKIHIEY